jgi:hypothetical protein
MSQQIWLKEDLRNILLSLNAASAAAARLSDESAVAAYRQGYQEAIETFAVALGIPPSNVGLRIIQPTEMLRSSNQRPQLCD